MSRLRLKDGMNLCVVDVKTFGEALGELGEEDREGLKRHLEGFRPDLRVVKPAGSRKSDENRKTG